MAWVLLEARKALRALLRRTLSRRTLVRFFVAMFPPPGKILRWRVQCNLILRLGLAVVLAMRPDGSECYLSANHFERMNEGSDEI